MGKKNQSIKFFKGAPVASLNPPQYTSTPSMILSAIGLPFRVKIVYSLISTTPTVTYSFDVSYSSVNPQITKLNQYSY